MGIVKGGYVRCKKTNKVGVVDETPTTLNFVYIRWFTSWDAISGNVNHYLEYVFQEDLQELSYDKIHPGLTALRQHVLR